MLYSYQEFKDISLELLIASIKQISRESDYYPTVKKLRDKCDDLIKLNKLNIITKMKDEGYFKRDSYGDLSDEQANRNYDKTLMWLEKRISPKWFEYHVKEYSIRLQISLLN